MTETLAPCTGGGSSQTSTPVYANEASSEAGVVKINPTVENNLGVRTSEAELGTLSRDIDTVGYIGFDEEKIFHVHTRVEGWVERLLIKAEGERVKKGQKLFEIYSPELVNAQEEYLTALKSGNQLLIGASEKRLRLLGVEKRQIKRLKETQSIRQRIDYFAEQNGFLNALNVREGMFVKPATDVLSIGQLDTVWVIAEVFEQQSGWIKPGQEVDMTASALPGQSWPASEIDQPAPARRWTTPGPGHAEVFGKAGKRPAWWRPRSAAQRKAHSHPPPRPRSPALLKPARRPVRRGPQIP